MVELRAGEVKSSWVVGFPAVVVGERLAQNDGAGR